MHALPRILLFSVLVPHLVAAAVAGEPHFGVTDDGASIIDRQSRLVWSRCAAGMRWRSGTCGGDPVAADFHEASSLAKLRSAQDEVAWRLPTMPELRMLAERLRSAGPQAGALFPEAPKGWYWTSSVRVETGRVNQYDYANAQRGLTEKNVNRIGYLHGWVVDVDSVQTRSDMLRRNKAAVRFVRRLED